MNKNSNKNILTVDLAISLGSACRPAHYLRENNLRRFSNPLDWMMLYSLETVVNLFKKDFSDFFLHKKEHPEKVHENLRYIEDTVNQIISIHSFPLNKELDVAYENFSQIMAYRYNRLKKYMLSAEHVLFVSNRYEPVEDFENFLTEMQKMFKCKMTYLNIRHEPQKQAFIKVISPSLQIIEHYFIDDHPDGGDFSNPKFWLGNGEEWDKVMKSIELSNKFTYGSDVIKTEDFAQK